MPGKRKAKKLIQAESADKQPHPEPLAPSSSIDDGTPPLNRDDSTQDSETTRKTSLAQPGNSTNAGATPETNDEDPPETRDDLSAADPHMRNLITDVLPAESVVPNEQAGEHSIDEDTQVLGDEQGEEPDPKRKRMVNEPLTPAQEEELVEWYRENAYLWNKRLKKYKLKCDKITEKERKAAELGITIQRLDTWLDTMRTRFRKLIIRKSGQGQKVYTEREQWIIRSFGFLKDHLLITGNMSIGNVPRPTSTETEMEDEVSESDDKDLRSSPNDTPSIQTPSTSGQQQRKPRVKSATATGGLDDDIKEMMRQVAASMTEINAKSQDPKEQYGQYFASKCKLVPSHSWYQFTKQIEEVCVRFMNMNPDQERSDTQGQQSGDQQPQQQRPGGRPQHFQQYQHPGGNQWNQWPAIHVQPQWMPPQDHWPNAPWQHTASTPLNTHTDNQDTSLNLPGDRTINSFLGLMQEASDVTEKDNQNE